MSNENKITEYIYLIREREFINCNKSVYKLGRTKQELLKRFNQYPKGSELIIQVKVNNCVSGEDFLKKEFIKFFKQRKDIGTEYFEGSDYKMCNIITQYCYNPVPVCKVNYEILSTHKDNEPYIFIGESPCDGISWTGDFLPCKCIDIDPFYYDKIWDMKYDNRTIIPIFNDENGELDEELKKYIKRFNFHYRLDDGDDFVGKRLDSPFYKGEIWSLGQIREICEKENLSRGKYGKPIISKKISIDLMEGVSIDFFVSNKLNINYIGVKKDISYISPLKDKSLIDINFMQKVCDYISDNYIIGTPLTKNSYNFKHEVEEKMGEYISNGQIILCCLMLNIEYILYSDNNSPNIGLYIGYK